MYEKRNINRRVTLDNRRGVVADQLADGSLCVVWDDGSEPSFVWTEGFMLPDALRFDDQWVKA
jgi:hypothetical protein